MAVVDGGASERASAIARRSSEADDMAAADGCACETATGSFWPRAGLFGGWEAVAGELQSDAAAKGDPAGPAASRGRLQAAWSMTD